MAQDAGPSTEATASTATTAASPDREDLRQLTNRARRALDAAMPRLLDRQHDDGHWCAELEGDSILQSEYILLKWILHQEDDPRLPKIAAYLRRQQQPDGAWVQYPAVPVGRGDIDISATVKGYLALKLLGDDPQADHMRKARQRILEAGGAERCNSFTKFYLAALGQIEWSAQPSIPPEIVYLPKWFYFHMDKVSSWTRTMIVPLAILTAYRPCRRLSSDKSIDELYTDPRRRNRLLPEQEDPHWFWSRFFLVLDRMLKWIDMLGMTPWRRRALDRLEQWLLEHLEDSDGIGAIFPPMVYMQIALRCRGYSDDHPVLVKARKDLDDFMIHSPPEDAQRDDIRIQPCFSPVWDTGIAAYALTDAGLDSSHDALGRAARWLVAKECRKVGDWINNVRRRDREKMKREPSGWFFEYHNPFYPDVDDTAMVAMALYRAGGRDADAAAQRGLNWLLALQNDDGGWAAFDRDAQNRPILEHVPFADHNAIQDPSCPDITGRVLESLGWRGHTLSEPPIAKAIAYLRKTQRRDGPWFGRWGVNYVYGTWQVVCGLRNVGQDMRADWIRRAGAWLKEHQHEDGAFGESPDSYINDDLAGFGPPTASQTAWGTMALMAIYGPDDPAVQRGIAWLCDTQLTADDPESGDPAGTWREDWFTGTGFPRVFYLRYHLYRLYFPIMCLGRWLRQRQDER
ncbi:MAG: squalene--hopene cyclase [Phycisphaeraceae bacterium]